MTASHLAAHAVGDYVLQNDWMANEKTRRNTAAVAHAATYTLTFLFLTHSALALAFIFATHFAIDRWRLARLVVYVWKGGDGQKHFFGLDRSKGIQREYTRPWLPRRIINGIAAAWRAFREEIL